MLNKVQYCQLFIYHKFRCVVCPFRDQQEFLSPRVQQQPEPQVAAPASQWQNAKLSNIPESSQSDHSKQKQIQNDILDKISEHAPSQTYMLRKLSQEFFKTKPGYGYINRLQDRSSNSDSSRTGSTSDSSRPGSSSYEIYPDNSSINSHSRSASQSEYGSRLSLPQQHSIGEDSGMFSARTSMSELSSQMSYQSQEPYRDKAERKYDSSEHYGVREPYTAVPAYSAHMPPDRPQDNYVPSSYQSPDERRQSMDHYENKYNRQVSKEYYSDTDTGEGDSSKQLSKSCNLPSGSLEPEFQTKDFNENQTEGYPYRRSKKLSLKKAYGIFDSIDTERTPKPIVNQSRSKSTSNVPFKTLSNYVDVTEAQRLAAERQELKNEWAASDRSQDSPQKLKRTSSEQLRPVKERYKDKLNPGPEFAHKHSSLQDSPVDREAEQRDHDYCVSGDHRSMASDQRDQRMSAGSDMYSASVVSSSSCSSHEDKRSDPKKSTQQALLSFFERKTGKRLSTSSMESSASAERSHERHLSQPQWQDQWQESSTHQQDINDRIKKSKSFPRELADDPAPQKKRPMHKWGELFLKKPTKPTSSASMDLGSSKPFSSMDMGNVKPVSCSTSMDLGSLPSNDRSMLSPRSTGSVSSRSSMDTTHSEATHNSPTHTMSSMDGTHSNVDAIYSSSRSSMDHSRSSRDATHNSNDATRSSIDGTRINKGTTGSSKNATRSSMDGTRSSMDATRSSMDGTHSGMDGMSAASSVVSEDDRGNYSQVHKQEPEVCKGIN